MRTIKADLDPAQNSIPAAIRLSFAAALFSIMTGTASSTEAALPATAPSVELAAETIDESRLQVPDGLSAEAVGEFVAPLTDAEVRSLLIGRLKTDQTEDMDEADSSPSLSLKLLGGLQDASMRLERETSALVEAVYGAVDQYRVMLRNLTSGKGWSEVLRTFGIFLLMAGFGLLLEKLFLRLTSGLTSRSHTESLESDARLSFSGLQKISIRMIGLILFSIGAYAVSLGFFHRFDPLRVLAMTWLFILVVVRGTAIISDALISSSDNNGLFRLSPDDQVSLRSASLWTVGIASFLFFHGSLFVILGITEELSRAYSLFSGLIVFLLTAVVVWNIKETVARLWINHSIRGEQNSPASWIRSWHLSAILLLSLTTALWALNTVIGNSHSASAAFWWLVMVVLAFAVRLLINTSVKRLSAAEDEDWSWLVRCLTIPRIALSITFGALALVFFIQAAGGGVYAFLDTDPGRSTLRGVFNVSITMVVAWIGWELIRNLIDRHLPEDAGDGAAMDFDGEGGEAAPASRAETLLPLLRGFLQFVVIVLVTLTVLSSLGVNIGPLLAGAGVIGLAVGFGAQKLVQDVISGIFFLVDDAFRTGEYIETADMRGTVEKISMRSLRLRHHLGMVQTIPYSEMATVKNHSRDYIIMKLKFRLPYDTDIEKVRKTIKKVGQELLKDPELGPGFLAPLKSQGVLEMEDSAMVMRMKFTAKPGEQWVIRREAFRRVRDALSAQGIEFAHRQVTVHLPKDLNADQRGRALGAVAAEEQENPGQPKPAEDAR